MLWMNKFNEASIRPVNTELTEDNIEEVLEAFEKLPLGFETAQEYRLHVRGRFDALLQSNSCSKAGAAGCRFGGASAVSVGQLMILKQYRLG